MNNFCYVYEKQGIKLYIVKPSRIYKIMWKSKYIFLKKRIKILKTMLN